ncbi:MAG: PIG-L family deacetylase [Acidimicrobiales bacterium]|nr:PIG-L family deacetylase [Acidimicrobiales bacterium]
MATLVAFHAHPDDECLTTGGTLARAVDDGHRVVVVYATRGEVGEVPDGLLTPGESLIERRLAEVTRSTAALGVHRVEFLGYRDSGMAGTPDNDHPSAFWQADVDEAAGRLAAILGEEGGDVLVAYDQNGNYGHPDHVQVHRVGVRAAELAGTPHVLEATINRDAVRAFVDHMVSSGDATWDDVPDLDDPDLVFGMPDDVITTRVDVRPWAERKLAAMRAHESQVGDLAPFLAMPVDVFRETMGTEYFIRRGVPSTHRDDDIFAGLDILTR